MSKITTKQQFLDLSKAGLLGNTLRTWWTVDDLRASGYSGAVTIRDRVRNSPHFRASVPVRKLGIVLAELRKAGAGNGLYFQELPHAPDCSDYLHAPSGVVKASCEGCGRTLNGEAVHLVRSGLYLAYGTSPALNLRADVTRGMVALGLVARATIQTLAGLECWEALQAIWWEWPNACIEFTAFRMPVGVRRERWVIWEVRDY